MTGGRLKPSDMILVSFDIIKDGLKPSPLNRVYSCYGHPDDGPATLTLRDSDGVVSIVHVEPITSLEENPHTGNTHFTGELIDRHAP